MLQTAFDLAGQCLAKAAGIREDRHGQKGSDSPLHPGDRVVLRNIFLVCNKIQDKWEAIPYRIMERISTDSPLYRVQRIDGQGKPKVVHRTAMLDINDVRAPARDTVSTPPEPKALRAGVAAGCKETTSEGSSSQQMGDLKQWRRSPGSTCARRIGSRGRYSQWSRRF